MLYAIVKRNRGGKRGILSELLVHAGCATLRGGEGFSAYILLQPVHEELGNFRAIFFGHELVPVPANSYILEIYVLGLYSGLIEPLGDAVGVRTVIARLSGHIEYRDGFQINELMRRFFLDPARDEVRPIRPVLAHGLQFRG